MNKLSDSVKKQPLVTIIIPCYNYGEFLSQATKSALNQDYKNIEIIIINDGSSDNTERVAKDFVARHGNVRYFSQENRGSINTRNRGVKLAGGEYVIFLDADDWMEDSYVKDTMRIAQKYNSEIVYTNMEVFGRENKTLTFPEHNIEYLKLQNYIHATSLIYKGLFEEHKFDEKLRGLAYDDWDFFLGACLRGASAKLCDKNILHYRKHQNYTSRSDKRGSSMEKELRARNYILSKYISQYPEQMKSMQTLNIVFSKILRDYEKSTQTEQLLQSTKEANTKLERAVSNLQREIYTMKQSKFWKAKEIYGRARHKIGLSR